MNLTLDYPRVIPRDLFNEANLLKCLGRLELCAGHEPEGAIELCHDGGPFVIGQDNSDGSIAVCNIQCFVEGRRIWLFRPLNSLESWALFARPLEDPDEDTVPVFTDEGELSEEFREWLK